LYLERDMKIRGRSIIRSILLAGAMPSILAAPCRAGSASDQFNVTATVLDNCAVSAGDLAFGDYSASSGTATTASSTLQVTCTADLAYTIALDGGTTAGAVAARAMSDGASHTLSYGLYTGSSYSTVWGDGTGGTATVAGTGSGSAQPVTVYGRIPAAQFVPAGSYSDLVTVTVNY
jgi:spore coat protein U-like protein